eukprot:TRINITY_DN103224_c0_g1_i1.p1 TRINITY_DN103224_c0_g1~~TRINITY_DN103224_c0_g1_i1.p1  ORF type:complete len:506 (+),score=72.39 TRINITY_DN103224_c0_g1_i1:53-1570(+)
MIGFCSGIFKCCCSVFLVLVVFVGILCMDPVRVKVIRVLHSYAPGVVPPQSEWGLPVGYLIPALLIGLPDLRHDGLTAFEGFMSEPRFAEALGLMSSNSAGLYPTVCQNGGWCLMRSSHNANKDVHYDPNTDRVEDLMIGINLTLTARFWAPGAQPTPLSLGTSDPRWWVRRDLMTATVPALARYPSTGVPALELPPFEGWSKSGFCKSMNGWTVYWSPLLQYGDPAKLAPDDLAYVVGYNFVKQFFRTEFTKAELDMAYEFLAQIGTLTTVVAQTGILPEAMVTRGQEIQRKLVDKIIERSDGFADKFMAEAKARGMDGKEALQNLFVAAVGAGMHAPGTTLYVVYVISKLNEDRSSMIPLYKKDPEAFNLEIVRHHGAGGANSNFHVTKTTEWKLHDGKIITERAGTYAMTNTKIAGFDPDVWGGPSKDMEYAHKFIPGRENRERVLAWMGELQDIRKCPNMTGCEHAPRFCPGAEFTQRLTRQVVDFYIESCVEGGKSKDEL